MTVYNIFSRQSTQLFDDFVYIYGLNCLFASTILFIDCIAIVENT